MLRYCLLLFVLCYMGGLQAANPSIINLTNQTGQLQITPHLQILEDSQRSLSIEQVISPSYASQFYLNTQPSANFGRTRSAYWIKFGLHNRSDVKWYLRINALLGHDVDLYVADDSGLMITDAIAHYLPNQGPHTWSLTLSKQKQLWFYIRATNGNSILNLPVELFASDNFVEQTRLDHNLYGSIIAILLVMSVYNLLSFFVLRESSYLALSVHIASVAVVVQITRPVYTGFDFLQNTDSHFFTAPVYIAVISLIIFSRQLLQTNRWTPKTDQLMWGGGLVSVGLIGVTGWIPGGTFFAQLMVIITFVLIIVASILRSLQGDRTARYYLIIFVFVTAIVFPNALINVMAETRWQSAEFYSTGVASVLFLLLLSIVQSEKVRGWREQDQRASARKEATDNFLMTISHELRSPLHTLIGLGELLKSTQLNPVQNDYLQKQENASQHMLNLVNDILDLSALSSEKQSANLAYEPFDLQELMNDLRQLFSVSAEQKGLTLILAVTPSSYPPLLGDVKYLKRVLINLLDNAIKYTEQGHAKLAIKLQKDNQLSVMTLHFEVSDTGVGIPVEKQSYLFQPFFQVRPASRQLEGSGLGLAISSQLIKQMGGELRVKSQPAEGSSFFFDLSFPIQKDCTDEE
ncbi:MAG: sensor histidine kinase [Thiolinea sp.]